MESRKLRHTIAIPRIGSAPISAASTSIFVELGSSTVSDPSTSRQWRPRQERDRAGIPNSAESVSRQPSTAQWRWRQERRARWIASFADLSSSRFWPSSRTRAANHRSKRQLCAAVLASCLHPTASAAVISVWDVRVASALPSASPMAAKQRCRSSQRSDRSILRFDRRPRPTA